MTAILPRSRNRYALIFTIGIGTLTGVASIAGCHKAPDATVAANDSGPDPANVNIAPVNGTQQQPAAPVYRPTAARALPARQENESQQSAEEYAQTTPQTEAPAYPQQPQSSTPDDTYDQAYEDQVDAGQQALEAQSPPPPLPTYEQPEAPGPNYIWTPGYWSYAPIGYYWVPGAWVMAPYPGALWTPGYWGYVGSRYRFNPGFWGTFIGFYGGINYGFGYTGSGYHGGYWHGDNFYYNRAVNRINETRITNVYNRTVVVNNNYNRVSYTGGPRGVQAHPQPAELAAMRAPRTPPMSTQIEHQREAAQNRQQFYNQNKGRPAIVAAPHPLPADHNVHPIVRPTSANLPHPNQPNSPQVQPPHPGQPQVQPVRPTQPQYHPGESQVRPVNPTPPRATPTQPEVRNAPQPQPTRPQPEIRPSPQPQPQVKPAPQPQPRPIPESQTRPVPQAQPRPVPETQPRPVPQAQPRPVPEAQPRPVPQAQPRPVQPQPQQMQRSQPAERPAPHSEFHSQPEQRPAPQARPPQAPHGSQAPHPEEHRH